MSGGSGLRFLAYEEIRWITEEYSKRHRIPNDPPIDIERYVDNSLKINVIPFPNLFGNLEVNAFISNDFRKIYVDVDLYPNHEPQFRFTLAHELGHMVLHEDYYASLTIGSLESYKEFISSTRETDYQVLETQAHQFAGLFLVPRIPLEKYFFTESKEISRFIATKFKGSKREQYLSMAVDLIANKLGKIFNVHAVPIRIRMEKDKLVDRIP
jgi:Zn-dependent peptidase ImmA (M78 family)